MGPTGSATAYRWPRRAQRPLTADSMRGCHPMVGILLSIVFHPSKDPWASPQPGTRLILCLGLPARWLMPALLAALAAGDAPSSVHASRPVLLPPPLLVPPPRPCFASPCGTSSARAVVRRRRPSTTLWPPCPLPSWPRREFFLNALPHGDRRRLLLPSVLSPIPSMPCVDRKEFRW
jgi:hypothetical protein